MLEKVMCIDDDQITLMLFEMIIKKSSFANEIVTAINGKEGLNWFSNYFKNKKSGALETPPQIIFLDLNMPIMNGWDFLEDYLMKYADRLSSTKIVILSSTVNPEDFSRANRYEIVIDFINKPLTIEELEELTKNEQFIECFSKSVI